MIFLPLESRERELNLVSIPPKPPKVDISARYSIFEITHRDQNRIWEQVQAWNVICIFIPTAVMALQVHNRQKLRQTKIANETWDIEPCRN